MNDLLCKSKSRQECSENINCDERQVIFDSYYSLDEEGKNALLCNMALNHSVKESAKTMSRSKVSVNGSA